MLSWNRTVRNKVNPNGSFKNYQALQEEYSIDKKFLVYAKRLAMSPETWAVALGSSDCSVILTPPRISPVQIMIDNSKSRT